MSTLKSGKTVELKELTALEDVLAYAMVGKLYDDGQELVAGVTLKNALVVLSITKVNDKDVAPPKTLDEVYKVLAQFTKKEWAEVQKLNDEVNGEEAEEEAGK